MTLTTYSPARLGTVYGTLLNFKREFAWFAPQMEQAPYRAAPKAPVLYVKTANTFNDHGGDVPVPARVPQIEVGATLAMVFGPKADVDRTLLATKTVAYWVLMNDFSIPHASYFRPPVKFKCLDGFLGIGAQRVPAEVLGDAAGVRLEMRINGVLKQTVDFSHLIRNAETLARDVREFMTLREGDALMLGLDCLPGGGRPLAQVGDTVEISSPNHAALGVLSNTLKAESV
jgi:5-oxopent-3-ene-1,2,5-tricarboxylate decarboxylase / 2-hydroxyhepta-2,4-diene-1,7-dioate isomerase